MEELKPIQCYAAINIDEQERLHSSSGGIFISLAKKTIEAGGVVFGAVFNSDWSVSHRAAETIEDVLPMMTSKYLQSRMANCFSEAKQYLRNGREVLFTGTPCQIAGLKHYLKKEYLNLLTVEVICHGVPAPGVWQNYLEEFTARPKEGHRKNTVLPTPPIRKTLSITSINFRDKRLGWKKFGFALSPLASVYGGEKNSVSPSIEDYFEPFGSNIYMQAFLNNWSLRPSCFECQTKSGHSHADITIGDFWGIDKLEEYNDDDTGTSCIIARSQKGLDTIDKLVNIRLVEASYTDILNGNSSIEKSVMETYEAIRFRKTFPSLGIYDTMYQLTHIPLWTRAYRFFKRNLTNWFS